MHVEATHTLHLDARVVGLGMTLVDIHIDHDCAQVHAHVHGHDGLEVFDTGET
jgi:hypothetical protein